MPPLTQHIPELSRERQSTYTEKNPDLKYFAVCGDDRGLTQESAAMTSKDGYADPNEALRVFGGLEGFARMSAAVIIAQHGQDTFVELFGSGFNSFAKEVGARAESDAVRVSFCNHTAEKNEDDAAKLNLSSDKGLGCAHGANAQLVTELNADTGVVARGKSEEHVLFNDQASEEYIDKIAQANLQAARIFSHDGEKSYNLNRDDFVAIQAPIVVVAGDHLPAKSTVVALNFNTDKISRPRLANEQGIGFYDQDVTQIAEAMIRTFPELQLDSRLVMETVIHDVRPTRKALAGSENLELEDLEIQTFGDPLDALAYLSSIKI